MKKFLFNLMPFMLLAPDDGGAGGGGEEGKDPKDIEPALSSGNRVIKSISRTNPGHLSATYTDGIEDWIISATLRYENEFNK